MAQELTEGITLFLGFKWSYCMETSVRTQVTEFGGVDWGVNGVVFSLTQLNIVELVLSSLTDWYTSVSGVN